MNELEKILSLIAEKLTVSLPIDAEVDALLRSASAQRKNILKAAFSGQLVPQDLADEPASVLLERIRAERTVGGEKPAAKRGRKPKADR